MGTTSCATSPSPGSRRRRSSTSCRVSRRSALRRPCPGLVVVRIDDAAHEAGAPFGPGDLGRRSDERLADPLPPGARLHAHHRVLPGRSARARQIRVATAWVEQTGALAALDVPERDSVVGMGGVEDLHASLEVGFGLGPADHCRSAQGDHPDRFSLPWRLAYCSPRRKTQRPSGIATTPITSSGQMSPQTSAGVAPSRMAALIPRSARGSPARSSRSPASTAAAQRPGSRRRRRPA